MTEEVSSEERVEVASRRQVFALVGLFMVSVLVIAVILAILSAGIGGSGGWWQRLTMSHEPVTKASLGQDITLTVRVTGWPKNVTLYYTVLPGNITLGSYQRIEWKKAYMLLIATGGDQYSYTIPGSEVQGSVYYYIAAADAYGNSAAEPIRKIAVGDFAVDIASKEMTVYVKQSAKTTVTVRSFNGFSSPVTLRVIVGGSDTLPGGLAAEFNPVSVSPPPDGIATSELTIRSTSDQFIPAGRYLISVEGRVSTPKGTMVRNSSVAILKVPDFDFTVEPTSQTVSRMIVGQIVEQVTPFNIILNIREGFESDLNFRVSGLPTMGVYYRWVIEGGRFNTTGTTTVTLQIVTQSVAPTGSYTLTIYVSGGGLEKFKQVSFIIVESTQR
jgi:hypothetical protein